MIVVDASVWVSALVDADVHHDLSERWVGLGLATNQRYVVPTIFLAEVAGSVSRRVGDPVWGRQLAHFLAESESFDIRAINLDLAIQASEIAAALPLKVADSLYVALAQQLSLPLVTWDREQLQRGAQIIEVRTPESISNPSV